MLVVPEIKTFYTGLMCSQSGEIYDKSRLQTFSRLGKPLLAKYDFGVPLDKSSLKNRRADMWRYREMLPVEADTNIISLGEGMTPLIPLKIAGQGRKLFLKDEAYNPSGSFKARGLSMAVSKAKELGATKCIIPTAGNAGGAMSAYCAKAGIQAEVYMPRQTPRAFIKECRLFGAKVTLVDGSIKDCAARLKTEQEPQAFDVSTLKEPFRLEGKKTMGYEIAEQLNWQIPDVVVYPTGGGTGLIGIWKAFEEMERLAWIGAKRPRMVAVQTDACFPIVEAFENGRSQAGTFANPGLSIANGLRVPSAFGDELILDILYQSQGCALKVSEKEIADGLQFMARSEGVLLCPEGAAVWAAYQRLLAQNWIQDEETTILLNTGSIYKYMENV